MACSIDIKIYFTRQHAASNVDVRGRGNFNLRFCGLPKLGKAAYPSKDF